MKLYTFQEFLTYHKSYNSFPNGLYCNPEKNYNDKQFERKYEDYLKSEEKRLTRQKKSNEMDDEGTYTQRVNFAMQECRKADPKAETFFNALSEKDLKFITKEMTKIPAYSIIDVAHIIGRGRCPKLADDSENLITVPRAFHTCIDSNSHPFTENHNGISKEKVEEIWRYVVGNERYDNLMKKKNS
jgi:hypothetical protein